MDRDRLQRASLLLQHRRHADAERELLAHLSDDPNDTDALLLLGELRLQQERPADAERIAREALANAPHEALFLHLLGHAQLLQDRPADAERSLRRAVEMDPTDAGYRGLLAAILLQRKEFTEALASADKGVTLDPEHTVCLNVRTQALAALGRTAEADRTIERTLALDPHNSHSHASTGWALLRRGEAAQALEHFREALRIDPTDQYAKAGLVEGLKARYLPYRWFLRYAFWIGDMKGKAQWAFIIGLYVVYRLLFGVARSNPDARPFVVPFIVLYVVFAYTTWTIEPLTNLLLRLNKYGRYALDRDELRTSTYTGAALALGLLGGVGWLFTDRAGLAALAIFGFLFMIPLASMLHAPKGGRRTTLIAATVLIGAIGAAGVVQAFATDTIFAPLMLGFAVLSAAYQWIANAVLIRS